MARKFSIRTSLILPIVVCITFAGCGTQSEVSTRETSSLDQSEKKIDPKSAKSSDPSASTKQLSSTAAPSPEILDKENSRLGDAPWVRHATHRTLAQAKADLEKTYRLKPDGRFIQALNDISLLFPSGKRPDVSLLCKKSKWIVSLDGKQIGTVSEFPDFDELFDVLVVYAKTFPALKKSNPESGVEISDISPNILLSNLRSLQKDWQAGSRSPAKLNVAANSLALLAWENLDTLQVADRLNAKTLALMAVSEANPIVSGATKADLNLIAMKAIMARHLGYFNSAKRWSALLKPDNPVRLYMQGDVQALKTKCQSGMGSNLESFCYVKALSDRKMSKEWKSYVQSEYAHSAGMALPIMSSFYGIAGEESLVPLGHHIMVATTGELENAKQANYFLQVNLLSWTYATFQDSTEFLARDLLSSFDKVAKNISDSASGAILDRSVVDSFYRSYLYSAVSLVAQSYLSDQSTREVCLRFANSLHTESDSQSKQIEQWFRDRIAVRARTQGPSQLENDLISIDALGTPARIALFDDISGFAHSVTRMRLIGVGRELFSRADGRPENRMQLSKIADDDLMDERLSYLLSTAARQNGAEETPDAKLRHHYASNDFNAMKQALQDSKLPLKARLDILHTLDYAGEKNQEWLLNQYKSLVNSHPDNWQIMQAYCLVMQKYGQLNRASQELSTWIARQKQFKFLDEAKAKAQLAEILCKQHKFAEGMKIVSGSSVSEEPSLMRIKVLLLQALGKTSDAETWAQESVKLYPDDKEMLATAVELAWASGNYSRAAMLLRARMSLLTPSDWRELIAPKFLGIFAAHQEKAVVALGALVDAGIKRADIFSQLALAADKQADKIDNHNLAYVILAHASALPEQQADLLTCAYIYLKRYAGKAKALEWIRSEVAPQNRYLLAPYAFITHQNELLWDVISDTPSGPDVERIWLYRAGAALFATDLSPERRKMLQKHFQDGTSVNAELGRYLLGMKNNLMSIQLDERQLCVAAFFVGWKSITEGKDYYEDTEWYRLALETNSVNEKEYRWAWDEMLMLELTVRQNKPWWKLGNVVRRVKVVPNPSVQHNIRTFVLMEAKN